MSTTPNFTILDHTADLGIKIHGANLIDLFENAGKVLIHLMTRINSHEKSASMKISISGDDLADLMVRWLGEILYLFEGERLVVTSINIDFITFNELEATLATIPFNSRTHKILREIKAVTYHQIEVTDKGDVWEARVIFDL